MSVHDSMTLRDTFAAAALAGLLPVRGGAEEMHETCSAAWGWADAMLRERAVSLQSENAASGEKTNLDAAPAAKAAKKTFTGATDADGTGDTPRVQPAIDRLREWERHGSGRWGLGAAGDVTMLERRLAIVEAIVHDAAPATRAAVAPGIGHTNREPLAWGVLPGGDLPLWRCRSREQAESVCAWLEQQRPGSEPQVVPLVDGRAAPTLTDAEREAVTRGAELADHSGEHSTTAAALRGLLKRLK